MHGTVLACACGLIKTCARVTVNALIIVLMYLCNLKMASPTLLSEANLSMIRVVPVH